MGAEAVVTHEFENCQENSDNAASVMDALEAVAEGNLADFANPGANLLHQLRDRSFVAGEAGFADGLFFLDDAAESADEIPKFDLADSVNRLLGVLSWLLDREAGIAFLPAGSVLGQFGGGLLELTILQESPDEFGSPEILSGRIVFIRFGFARKHATAFDFDERAGDHEKFAGHVEIDPAQHIDVGDELGGDLGEGDLTNIDFTAFDEIEQQIKGAAKEIEINLVIAWLGGLGIHFAPP